MWNRRHIIGAGAAAAALAAGGRTFAQTVAERVEIDLHHDAGPLDHIWQRCVGSDRASVTLREPWRKDLERFKKETGTERVRFHGIFNDDLGVWPGGMGGKDPNFQLVDEVYDGLMDRGVRPYVEMSFMPRHLASGTTKLGFTYNANITPPASSADWGGFIETFVRHLVGRYGASEVREWNFEVWNEPNLKWFFTGTQEQYFEMYKAGAMGVKAVDSAIRVGGPATAAIGWIPDFLAYCERENLPMDFLSTHIYPGDDQKEIFGQAGKYTQSEVIPAAMALVRSQIDATRFKGAELWLTEWSSDSPAMIAHIITKCLPYCHAMSQWCLSSMLEELNIPNFVLKAGDNGWGMLAQHSIAKPAFNTYKLLYRLGNRRVSASGPALATKTDKGAAAIVWNLADVPQPSGFPDAHVDRKVTGVQKQINVTIKGAHAGAPVKVSYVDWVRGSPLPQWQALGSPKYPTKQQLDLIRKAADIGAPEIRRLGRNSELAIDLPPEGIALIEL